MVRADEIVTFVISVRIRTHYTRNILFYKQWNSDVFVMKTCPIDFKMYGHVNVRLYLFILHDLNVFNFKTVKCYIEDH